MKLFIRINRRQNDYRSRAEGIIRKLVENGFEVSLFKVDARAVFSSEEYASFGVEESDYVVSIGGDGTFLKGGLLAATYDKPVFGVNIGRLGYLCRFDEKSLETLTPEVLTGCPIEEKMLLEVSDSELLAINDVVIGKDCRIKRAIIDGHNIIPDGTVIGEDPEADAKNYYVDPKSGLVVMGVPKVFYQSGHDNDEEAQSWDTLG